MTTRYTIYTGTPKTTRKTGYAYFDGSYGHLTTIGDDGDACEIITTCAHPDRYIRIDDGRQYPQLCANGSLRGSTLIWAKDEAEMGEAFARDCGARHYKTEAGYRRAVAKAAQ